MPRLGARPRGGLAGPRSLRLGPLRVGWDEVNRGEVVAHGSCLSRSRTEQQATRR